MCGFIGAIRHMPSHLDEEAKQRFKHRSDVIAHRGPDDEGYYHDEHVSFGFRRLSIIDVKGGHQPLSYEDERYWVVFNGEIYNYVELRESLRNKGYTFRTESDTEVIAATFGDRRELAFSYFRGMFSILIWDKEEKTLYGARDPFGIKPLFYSERNGATYFASEKKSIALLPEDGSVNTEALQHYLSFQYVPEPMTLTNGIRKVEPGYYFVKKPSESIAFHRYFHATFAQVPGGREKWIRKIQGVLYDSVKVHMRSDVPVGCFLSGGIDSSIIVAMAREFNPHIKTFSVGFRLDGYSEVDVAKETADKLGVENFSYIISPEEFIQKLPRIMWHMDDPLADPSCVPLYFVAREARKHVTVVLSGEGADELFGGYNIYREPASLKIFGPMPNTVRVLLGRVARKLPEGVKGRSFVERGTTPLSQRYIGNAKVFEEADKQSILKHYHMHSSYQSLTARLYSEVESDHAINQMQYIDVQTWLRGDILLKADKMTMANSLELRVPFLDTEVFSVARQLPVNMKVAQGTTKSILREASRGIVPDHVLDRKKLGFPVPIRHWLRNELYDWAKELIQSSGTDHLIDRTIVMRLLELHVQGRADYSRKIWTVLMFMLWHQIYVERKYSMEEFMREGECTSQLPVT